MGRALELFKRASELQSSGQHQEEAFIILRYIRKNYPDFEHRMLVNQMIHFLGEKELDFFKINVDEISEEDHDIFEELFEFLGSMGAGEEAGAASSSDSAGASAGQQDFVFFWMPEEENGFLSQWYQAPMNVDGVVYANCEQYMMAKKALAMGDFEYYGKIMQETDPAVIKKLGREIRGFDSAKWDECKAKIIYDGNYAKFSQNEDLKERLLATGNAILAEASRFDNIYGIGFAADDPEARQPEKWTGQSILGKALMQIRKELKG